MFNDGQQAQNKTRKNAASSQAYEAIKSEIIHHRLAGGTPLIEEELAAKYDLSRTPIREALKRLENDKLVTYYPYRGCFVNRFDRQDIIEIYTVRMALECICCRDIVEKGIITDEYIGRLEESVRASQAALDSGDAEAAAHIGDYLHDSMISLMGNSRIQGILQKMNAQCLYFNNISIHLEGRVAKSIQEHSAVVQALKTRNAKLAEELLRTHILTTQQDVLTAMSNCMIKSEW